MQNLTRNGNGFAWRLDLDALTAGMDAIAGFPETGSAAYFGPTLVMAGEASDYVRDEHVPAIRDKFPRAVVERVPGAGHWVHADAPAAFLERAAVFLAA
jgi:pimeloyl-ACP methyl ester carboxylesterase